MLNKEDKIFTYGTWFMRAAVWAVFFGGIGISCFAQDLTSSTISSALNNFDEAFEELQRERKALKEEVDDLKRDRQIVRDTFDRKVEEVEDQKLNLVEALENAQSRAQQIEEEKLSLLDQIEDLKVRLNKHDDVVNIKDVSLGDAQKEIERLNEHIARVEQAFEKSAQRIQRLQEEKEDLERELEIMKEERKKILFDYEDDFEKIKKEKKDLEERLESFQKEFKKKDGKAAHENQQEESLREKHKKEMLKVMEAQGLLKKEVNELTCKQADVIKEYERRASEAARVTQEGLKEMKGLKKENEKLKGDLVTAHQKEQDLKRQVETLQKQNLDLAKRKDSDEPLLGKMLGDAQKSSKAYEKQIKELKDRLAMTQEKLNASQHRLELMADKARMLTN